MKIIVHYPTNDKGREELARRVAEVHADTAIQYIEKLLCSKEQKVALIDTIISDKKQEQNNE